MNVLVTGGGGFLGKAIVRLLVEQGDRVTSLARSYSSDLAALGVNQQQGDIADPAAVSAAVAGTELVFHVAAKAGVWGNYDDYYRPNVLGTQNVIDACRRHGVERLVYTSSPSVVFNGKDMEGCDETVPYPDHYLSWYPQTKAAAERLVLAADGPGLTTVALRPHLIWGPEDNHLVPRILERGRKGQLRRIGRRDCLVDTVYIDNAAQAHLAAAQVLAPGSAVSGQVYFIANGEPVPLWQLVNQILAAGGVTPVSGTIPSSLAYGLGWLLEQFYRLFKLPGEPRLTRFVAEELSTAHWFDLSAARRDFGYRPQVSIDEGLARLAAWLDDHEQP